MHYIAKEKLPVDAVSPRCSEHFTHYAILDKTSPDPLNEKVYVKEKESLPLPDLLEDIVDSGLRESIRVWKDEAYSEKGNTRLKALSLPNSIYTHIPCTIGQERKLLSDEQIIDTLVGSNQYREKKFPPKFRSVRLREDLMISKGTRATDEQIKKWCKRENMDYGDYSRCTQLEVSYPKLFKKVMDDILGVRVAYKEATAEKIKMKTEKDLPYFGDNDVKSLCNGVFKAIKKIKDIKIVGSARESINPLQYMDKNFFSNAMHGTICSWLADYLNRHDDYTDDYKVTTTQDKHDVVSELDETGFEVKTILSTTTPTWTPHRFKEGYHLLFTCDPNYKSVFCCIGNLDEDSAEKIGGNYKILNGRLMELYEQNKIQVLVGDIDRDTDDPNKIIFTKNLVK